MGEVIVTPQDEERVREIVAEMIADRERAIARETVPRLVALGDSLAESGIFIEPLRAEGRAK